MTLLYNQFDLGTTESAADDRMQIKYNNTLKNLSVCTTKLHRGCTTDLVESSTDTIHFFIQGTGIFIVGDQRYRVTSGSVIMCPRHSPYQVVNDGEMFLIYNCVYSTSAL